MTFEQALVLLERIREIDPHWSLCVTTGENYHGRDCDCHMREVWAELDRLMADMTRVTLPVKTTDQPIEVGPDSIKVTVRSPGST